MLTFVWSLLLVIGYGLPDQKIQDELEFKAYVNHEHVFYTLRLSDGQFDTVRYQTPGWNDQTEQLRFLESDDVRQEIDLTIDQCAQLDKLIGDMRSAVKQVTAGVKLQMDPAEAFTQSLKEETQRFQDGLKELLLPFQVKSLQQLIMRLKVRQSGLIYELAQGELRKQLTISFSDLGPLISRAKEIATRFQPRVDEFRIKSFMEMVEVLNKTQRDEMDPILREYLNHRVPPLEVLVWQLEHADEIEQWSKAISRNRLGGLHIGTAFRLDCLGRLVATNSENPDEVRQGFVHNYDWYLCSTLLQLLQEEWMIRELALSDEQLAAIDESRQLFRDNHDSAVARRQGLKGEERRRISQMIEQEQQKLAEECINMIDKILLPLQTQLLERIAEMAEVVQGGIRYALVYGQLGRRLGITADQVSRLSQVAERLVEEINREALQWEDEIMDELFQLLDSDQRQLLEDLIGRKPKHIPPNVDLLLNHLYYPLGRTE